MPDWIDELTQDGISGDCLSAMSLVPHAIGEYRRIKQETGVAPQVCIENGAIEAYQKHAMSGDSGVGPQPAGYTESGEPIFLGSDLGLKSRPWVCFKQE